MECGVTADWLSRVYCHMGNSYVDELVAYVSLVIFGVVMIVGLVKTFIEVVVKPKRSDQSDAGSGMGTTSRGRFL